MLNVHYWALLLSVSLWIAVSHTEATPIKVELSLDTHHKIGDDGSFDRKKFITIHSSHTEPDWKGEEEKLDYLLNKLDIYFGRDSGYISSNLRLLREDPLHKGYVDFADMKRRGDYSRKQYAEKKDLHQYEERSDLVIAAQVVPFWPGSAPIKPQDGSTPWKLANAGATAQYMVYWLNMYTGGEGAPRPQYLEIMNEPLYELGVSHPEVTPNDVFLYHAKVASGIRALNDEVQLGGYTTAFPDFEKDNFGRWEKRWKAFVDIMGEDIDFYSFHLYDFPGIHRGKKKFRKGANFEATFDMLEHYSMLKFGKIKPMMVSEYGSQLHDWFNQPWSPYRDWLCLKAINSMLMQMSAKPDRILKAIPFITAKAEWGHDYGGSGQPYYWRLLRKENEPESYTGDWVFTDQIKFYELWSGVRGERRHIKSNDPNLLTAAYLDGKNLSVIFNNLTTTRKEISLKTLGLSDTKIEKLTSKHLYLFENKPRLDWIELPTDTSSFTLGSEATVVLEMTLSNPPKKSTTLQETKHFATTYLQKITKDTPITFTIKGLPKSERTAATLRLGIGRNHGLSLQPTVTFNGTAINVPETSKGPSQKDRETFFGVLEISIPPELLKSENKITVTFPDDSGHVSSVALTSLAKKN